MSDSTSKTVGPENEEREEETGYSLVAVTQGMKNFINAMSSHEGAEIPRFVISNRLGIFLNCDHHEFVLLCVAGLSCLSRSVLTQMQ